MAKAHAHIGPRGYVTAIETGDHRLTADEPASRGGTDAGPAPYDLLLSALGACTAITLRMYADRKGWAIDGLDVDLRIVRHDETNHIVRTLTISGPDTEAKARLAEIAERTPVTLTISGPDTEAKARLAEIAERTPVTLTLKQGIAIETHLAD